MTEQMKEGRAAGYIRVPSKEQVDGESLSTQRESIRNFVKSQDWKLTDIYSDEGISGGSVKERHALLQCLHDGQDGKFNVLVIHRLSRFGRNARELLNNQSSRVGTAHHEMVLGIGQDESVGRAHPTKALHLTPWICPESFRDKSEG